MSGLPSPLRDLRTVAFSAQPAPGVVGNAIFEPDRPFVPTSFGLVLNQRGEVAFYGTVVDSADSTNLERTGVWAESGGELNLVAIEGEPAPDVGGDRFARIADRSSTSLTFNDSGVVGFSSLLQDDCGILTGTGTWVGSPGSVSLLATGGEPAPQPMSDQVLGGLAVWPPAIVDSDGFATFTHYLIDPVDGRETSATTFGSPGDLQALVQFAIPAPGFPTGALLSSPSPPGRVGRSGPVYVRASVSGLEPDAAGDTTTKATYIVENGELRLLFDDRALIPETPPGVSVEFILSPNFNQAGNVAFFTHLAGDSINDENDEALWIGRPGELDLIARSGDHAPGTDEGVVFGGVTRGWNLSGVSLDGLGNIHFIGGLSGDGVDNTNDRGIWSSSSGSLQLVARTGDPAPGAPEGALFSAVRTPLSNALGQIAFRGEWILDGEVHSAIWATDLHGDLQLIASAGNQIEVAPGDIRTLQSIRHFHFHNFNDLGHVAFTGKFSDLSFGAFVSQRVAVPEPATLGVAVMLLGWGLMMRRAQPTRD